jgi:hypothetical protein
MFFLAFSFQTTFPILLPSTVLFYLHLVFVSHWFCYAYAVVKAYRYFWRVPISGEHFALHEMKDRVIK